MAIEVTGDAAGRRHRQGPDPGDHRQDRHRRRPGPHRRVPRRGRPQALHGGPDDGLQHVHRGGRPGGHDRAGRDHVRLPQGPPARADRRRLGRRRSPTGRRCAPTTTPSSTQVVEIDATHADAVRHLGHQPGPGRCRSARRCPTPEDFADPIERAAAERALEYMGLTARHPAARHRGRHGLRRLLHQRPDGGPARRRRDPARPQGRHPHADRPRLDAGQGCRPSRRACTRCSRPRAPSGARRAARCAWA